MFALDTIVQHTFRSPRPGYQRRKNKQTNKNPNWKRGKIAGVLLNTYGKPNREGRRSPGMNPEKLLTKRTVNLYM
mgnify:CR=1 FL=1